MLEDRGLRLRGRPDLSVRNDQGHIEVVDFKSGRIADLDDQLLDEHVLQVQLYALMLERAFRNPGHTFHRAGRTSCGPLGRQRAGTCARSAPRRGRGTTGGRDNQIPDTRPSGRALRDLSAAGDVPRLPECGPLLVAGQR